MGKNVSHPEEYDLVVLGSGRARFFAWSLASQGKRAAVVERRNLAGSCPTIACSFLVSCGQNSIFPASVMPAWLPGSQDLPGFG